MTGRLVGWQLVGLHGVVHAAKVADTSPSTTACGLDFTSYLIPNARTTDCAACRAAIGLDKPEREALIEVARKSLKKRARRRQR